MPSFASALKSAPRAQDMGRPRASMRARREQPARDTGRRDEGTSATANYRQ